MNLYEKRYNQLIFYYTSKTLECKTERHHIVPRCMGGSDEIDNIVALPPRAHFIAHFLLHRAYPKNRKLAHAFAMMGVNNHVQERQVSSRMYEASKLARRHALTGVPRPEWVKEKLRKPKSNAENYCKPKSKEHAANISAGLKGKKKSAEHIAKAVASRKTTLANRRLVEAAKWQGLFGESGMTKKAFAALHGVDYSVMKRHLNYKS